MGEPTITYHLEGSIARVGLNRPAQLNSFTPDMLDLLREQLVRSEKEGARCVLLTGEGRAFSAGADLGGFDPAVDPPDLGALLRDHYNPVAETLANLKIPVVSAINGAAAGAGASIALAADIVVAARSSYLLLAFANVGLVPDAGATWLIAKSAGRAKTLAMALLGERLPAEEALKAGLITRVADDDRLSETAMDLATQLANKPTFALGMIRRQVRMALSASLSDALAVECEHQQQAGWSLDFEEGIRAFREKRTPQFLGR